MGPLGFAHPFFLCTEHLHCSGTACGVRIRTHAAKIPLPVPGPDHSLFFRTFAGNLGGFNSVTVTASRPTRWNFIEGQGHLIFLPAITEKSGGNQGRPSTVALFGTISYAALYCEPTAILSRSHPWVSIWGRARPFLVADLSRLHLEA